MHVMQGGIKAPAAGRLVTSSLNDKLSLSPKLADEFGQPLVGTSAVRIGIPLGFPEPANFEGHESSPTATAPFLCPRVLFMLPEN